MTGDNLLREKLMKLLMLTDVTLETALNAPVRPEVRRVFLDSFSSMHFYFVMLTIRALEDRKLAEQLISIFAEANTRMVAYTNTLNILSDVLRLKHGIEGALKLPRSMEELEKQMEKIAKSAPYGQVKAAHDKLKKAAEEESYCSSCSDLTEENIMYR
ncbi:MAG: hypothetical protein QXI12_13270 [Candidatus Methanomethyliaceae archaeon]